MTDQPNNQQIERDVNDLGSDDRGFKLFALFHLICCGGPLIAFLLIALGFTALHEHLNLSRSQCSDFRDCIFDLRAKILL